MKFDYKFKDSKLGGVVRTPVLTSDRVNESKGVVHELLAPNGKGKSFLLNFIVHSLVDDVKLEPNSSWFLSPEKIRSVDFFRQEYSGQIEGELLLDIGDYVFRSTYEFGKPVRREFCKADSDDWYESSDSLLWRHVNLAFLVPSDPAERVEKLRGRLVDQIGGLFGDYKAWMSSLSVHVDDACRMGQDKKLLKDWKKKVEEIKKKIESKSELVKGERSKLAGYSALGDLRRLKRLIQKEVKLTRDLSKVKKELEGLPPEQEAPDTQRLLDKLNDARHDVDSHDFARRVRKIVSLVAAEDESFQREFQALPLIEDLSLVLELIGWRNVKFEDSENCFVTDNKQMTSRVLRLIENCDSRRSEITKLLDVKLAKESSEKRVLDVLRQFIVFIEDNRGDALNELFESKLGVSVSVDSFEKVLVAELKKLEGDNSRAKLDEELDICFDGINDKVKDYQKKCKILSKRRDAFKEAASYQGDAFAEQRMKLSTKRRDLKLEIQIVESDKKQTSNRLTDFQFEDWSDEKVRNRFLLSWQKAYGAADAKRLNSLEAEVASLEDEQTQLLRKIELEERKPDDVLEGFERNRAMLLRDLLNQFPLKLKSWQSGLNHNTLEEDDSKYFGSLVSEKLGGVVRFDGENKQVDYIDFVNQSFVLADGSPLLFKRLSGAQAGEVAFRLHVDPMLSSGKPTILLFDEAGDMDADTWENIYDWMRENRDSIQFMLKVGAKKGPVVVNTRKL